MYLGLTSLLIDDKLLDYYRNTQLRFRGRRGEPHGKHPPMARGVRTAFLVAATCFLAVASMAESNSHLQLCCVNYSSLNVLQCERPDQTNCSAAGRHSNLTCYNLTKIKTSCPRSEPASARELHIGAFVPRLSRDDRGFFAGMNLAVALINNRTDLLRNYTLVLHGVDTYSVSIFAGSAHHNYYLLHKAARVLPLEIERGAPKSAAQTRTHIVPFVCGEALN